MQRRKRTQVSVVIEETQLRRAVYILRRGKYLSGLPDAERAKLGEEDRELLLKYESAEEKSRREIQPLIDAVRSCERVGQGYNLVINC